jgi:hypothetical protein
MKTLPHFAIFIAICCLLIGSAPITSNSKSAAASAVVDNLSPTTNHELTQARNGTAKYHDFDRADEEGYEFLACVEGEGFEYVNWSLVDCNFDIEHPEALHYIPEGNGQRLVGVEYVIRWLARPHRRKVSLVTTTNGSLWQKACPSGH